MTLELNYNLRSARVYHIIDFKFQALDYVQLEINTVPHIYLINENYINGDYERLSLVIR